LTGLKGRKQCFGEDSTAPPDEPRSLNNQPQSFVCGDEAPNRFARTGARKEENLMAEFACALTGRSSNSSSPTPWKARAWLPVILTVTGLALAGCNTNQGVSPSGQANLGAIYPNYSPYNPIQYAQTSGLYGGR
jgi:hypothetical protein